VQRAQHSPISHKLLSGLPIVDRFRNPDSCCQCKAVLSFVSSLIRLDFGHLDCFASRCIMNTAWRNGTGMFPREVMKRFPLLPMEEEGRLNDMPLRENFIERVFAYYRWTEMLDKEPTP
jgi:hypothetical protein